MSTSGEMLFFITFKPINEMFIQGSFLQYFWGGKP